jgi:hypothetical protein
MPNRIVNITMVALAMVAVFPAAVNAQESAGIRASARVVRSVLPETQAATEILLEDVAQIGSAQEAISSHSVSTANGIAQVYTERLAAEGTQVWRGSARSQEGSATRRESVAAVKKDRIRLTVAFTAN